LRVKTGLTQAELAALVEEPQANIAYWERSDKPPRSDVLPRLAKALGVRVEDLLGVHATVTKLAPLTSSSGPVGQIQRAFEEARRLPRSQQRKVAEFVSALVEQYKRKAS
jgi:transcriptional regulator with XRE-family HTH domain